MSNQNHPEIFAQRRLWDSHQGEIYRIRWSPNGYFLASPSKDNTIALWSPDSAKRVKQFTGHSDRVYSVAWSPDSQKLASASRDKTICIWDVNTGQVLQTLDGADRSLYSLVWSPDGKTLASACHDKSIWLWNLATGQVEHKLVGHTLSVFALAYSAEGNYLASGSHDKTIRIWSEGQSLYTLEGHTAGIYGLAWLNHLLASCSDDRTIRIWDSDTGQQKYCLESHTRYVTSVSFSADGNLLASKSGDHTVRLWRCDTWESIATLPEPRNPSGPYFAGLAFHPTLSLLATLGNEDTAIRLWHIDYNAFKQPTESTIHYTNAKVVIVGDTGVGKSGLSLVLAGKPYKETDSTHNRNVYLLDTQHLQIDTTVEETREIYLWDLAGQPGYRLIHQLHLDDVSVALVVCDARNEVDPLSGVRHWVRALRQAQQSRKKPVKMLLVGARADRGGIGISKARQESLLKSMGFDGYFETSAKESWKIPELREAIIQAVDWDIVPRVGSTQLFSEIKEFLVDEQKVGRRMAAADDLYYEFLRYTKRENSEDLRAQFDTCISLVESRGLIKRLSFGDLVLLKPELVDAYASALVNAAKSEPDGLGCIREDDVLHGRFLMSAKERIESKGQERLILIATVEKLLRHEIALRAQGDDVAYLVFPSQLTREHPAMPNPEGKRVVFRFEGPIANIYATLVVRLAQSGIFKLQEIWRNAAIFSAVVGGAGCGIFLHEREEAKAELVLFFEKSVSDYNLFQFEEYIHAHLRRRANQVEKHYFVTCPACQYVIPDEIVQARRERNFDAVGCPICGEEIALVPARRKSVLATVHVVAEMDKVADIQRERAAATSVIDGKIASRDFDIFLCHNSRDKAFVKQIGQRLKERGLLPWLDEWELRPGLPWQKVLEQQIESIKSVAVFVGENGIGPWQDMEQAAFIRQFVNRGCPVIPVILPTCQMSPNIPMFLSGMTWIDFRKNIPDPFEQLIWGITGQRNEQVS